MTALAFAHSAEIEMALKWWRDKQGIDFGTPEHAIAPGLYDQRHEYQLSVPGPGGTAVPRVVVFHALGCGCDALPDHVLLEG